MHTLPVQHGDPDSAKRIEGRFRQLAKHQGVNANQLKLNLMEHYLNQWRCKLALTAINVCVLDDAFRRKMRKPIPVYLSVSGLTLITSHQGIAVRLPCYVSPYEHCRIISLEKYRGCPDANGMNFNAMLLPQSLFAEGLAWEGYVQIFDPIYHQEMQRNRLIESVKADLYHQVQQGLERYQRELEQ
ncbi:MAG: hypothetical protein PW844_17530 [Pantoea sp.]|uniref:hypothetical protein n=1 Tax=unclassified Pantoea TaxID=2630326 RepID=UPI00238D2F49|nr:hypothetical protein [Pantoea sp.]MDE1188268.1 hypothetical protein [Pantoea sp.]